MEKSMLLEELFSLRKADKERGVKLLKKLDRMSEQLQTLSESSQAQSKLIDELKHIISDLQKQNELLQKENASLKEQKKLSRKGLYGAKSQKLSGKREEVSSHEENKGDVLCQVGVKICCFLQAVVWPTYQRPIIRCCQLAV